MNKNTESKVVVTRLADVEIEKQTLESRLVTMQKKHWNYLRKEYPKWVCEECAVLAVENSANEYNQLCTVNKKDIQAEFSKAYSRNRKEPTCVIFRSCRCVCCHDFNARDYIHPEIKYAFIKTAFLGYPDLRTIAEGK